MKSMRVTILLFAVLVSAAFAQDSSSGHKSLQPQRSDLEMRAITNLNKFFIGESRYAISHPNEGFACDPQVLTKVEWPNLPNHVHLVEPALLSGTGDYKFSASCPQDSKPGSKLNIFAIPIDPHSNLRTFCTTGTFGPFEMEPYVATGKGPIRSISVRKEESCLESGEPLK
jgi:hypothetical protein